MKHSEKYLEKHTNRYANFAYSKRAQYSGVYSAAGIEVEYAEVYGKICNLEGIISFIEGVYDLPERPSFYWYKQMKKEYQKEIKKLSK